MNSDSASSAVRSPSDWVEELCYEQRQSWDRGRHIPVESYLQRHPELQSDSDAVLDLILNEVVLREERDEPSRREEYIERFPTLAAALQRLFDVHEAVASSEILGTVTASAADGQTPVARAHPGAALTAQSSPIGGYEIHEEIGRGGMGIVYKARQPGTGRVVALKVILTGRFACRREIQRFRSEAQAAARLDHPGIVPVYEVGQTDDLYYLSMAYVEGETLATNLARGPLAPRRAAAVARDLADALEAAHAQHVIHRDLKPHNILVDRDGQVRITDFGLARQNDRDVHLTSTGQIVGTPQYMAPEQAQGQQELIGPASDLYALGATLYCALTGRPPFDGSSAVEVLSRVVASEPVSPRLLNPAVPRDLETICRKCLQKEPHRRYQTACDLADDLRRFLAGEPIVARPVGRAERLYRWCRRQPLLAALSAGIVVLLVALVAGATAAGIRLRAEHKQTLQHLQRARGAETLAQSRLLESLIARVRTGRRSGHSGQRLESLQAIDQAVDLLRERPVDSQTLLTLRNEAVASLILNDVEAPQRFSVPVPQLASLDPRSERRASWDPRAGRIVVVGPGETRRALLPPREVETPAGLRFSRTGRFLAALADDRRALLVYDLTQSEQTPLELQLASIADYAFPADDSSVIVVAHDGQVSLFRIDSGTLAATFDAGGPISGCRSDPAGARLAVWHDDRLAVIDLQDGAVVEFREHPRGARIQCCDWSPDGMLLAVGASDHNAFIWNAGRGPYLLATLRGHQAWVTDVAFHPQGDLLMTASRVDGRTRLWDAGRSRELLQFDGRGRSFSTDGGRVLGEFDEVPAQWRIVVNRIVRRFRSDAQPYSTIRGGFCDEQLLATFGWEGLRLWDVRSGEECGHVPLRGIHSMDVARDGRLLVTGGPVFPLSKTGGLHVWPIEQSAGGRWSLGSPRELPVPESLPCVQDVSLGSPGTVAAAGHGLAFVTGLDDTSSIGPTVTHPGANRCAISPDGRWLVTSGTQAAGLRIWDTNGGRLERELFLDRDDAVAAFSPDGRMLFTGVAGDYGFWDCDAWERAHGIRTGVLEQPVTYASFSPDGRLLATSDRLRRIKLFDTATGEGLVTLPTDHYATWVCISSDNSKLAAMDELTGIHLWDLQLLRSELRARGLDWPAFP